MYCGAVCQNVFIWVLLLGLKVEVGYGYDAMDVASIFGLYDFIRCEGVDNELIGIIFVTIVW